MVHLPQSNKRELYIMATAGSGVHSAPSFLSVFEERSRIAVEQASEAAQLTRLAREIKPQIDRAGTTYELFAITENPRNQLTAYNYATILKKLAALRLDIADENKLWNIEAALLRDDAACLCNCNLFELAELVNAFVELGYDSPALFNQIKAKLVDPSDSFKAEMFVGFSASELAAIAKACGQLVYTTTRLLDICDRQPSYLVDTRLYSDKEHLYRPRTSRLQSESIPNGDYVLSAQSLLSIREVEKEVLAAMQPITELDFSSMRMVHRKEGTEGDILAKSVQLFANFITKYMPKLAKLTLPEHIRIGSVSHEFPVAQLKQKLSQYKDLAISVDIRSKTDLANQAYGRLLWHIDGELLCRDLRKLKACTLDELIDIGVAFAKCGLVVNVLHEIQNILMQNSAEMLKKCSIRQLTDIAAVFVDHRKVWRDALFKEIDKVLVSYDIRELQKADLKDLTNIIEAFKIVGVCSAELVKKIEAVTASDESLSSVATMLQKQCFVA